MSLLPPPRDEKGGVIPHDHIEICSNDGIIRRISEQQLIFDEKSGTRRISSLALKPSSGPNGGLSVDLQQQIEDAGLNAKSFVTTPRWMGSIRFEAGHLRAEGFLVGYDPIFPENPYHGEVWGNFTRSKQAQLFQLCQWFVPIENTLIYVS